MILKFSTADTERVRAFALRYSCLVEELGDNDFVVAPYKLFIDEMDGPLSALITAWDGDQLVATVRMLFRKDHPFIEDGFYQWDWLAATLGATVAEVLDATFLFDRACVRQEYRRRGLYDQMLAFARGHGVQSNMRFIVSAFESTNQSADKWAKKNGFSFYPDLLKSGNREWHLIYSKL